MSYIKVEHSLYNIYFLASGVKEEKQECERNMGAFENNKAQEKTAWKQVHLSQKLTP